MNLDLSPYLGFLIFSAVLTASLGVYAWTQRGMPGAVPFMLLMFDASLWAIANALEMAGVTLSEKLAWANLQYLCYSTIPVLWLALALQFTGRQRWLTERLIFGLLIIPLITNILVWTDVLHGLVRYGFQLDTAGPFPVIAKSYGPWAYIHSGYSYLLMGAALVLLASALGSPSPYYRGQALTLVMGLLIPAFWNFLYFTGLSPVKRHDLSPAIISFAGLFGVWGLFRFRLFDIVPVAHDAVLNSIGDGVIVINARGQVNAINPAAQALLDWPAASVIGKQSLEVFIKWPKVISLLRERSPEKVEFVVQWETPQQFYELSLSPLLDRYSRPIGQLLIFHDISDRKRDEAVLRSLSQTDALTGLANRRRFFDRLEREILRARRYKTPLSVIMIDVNGLKSINDRFGHQAGDTALRLIAEHIQPTRQSDVVARVGGDEFALLLPSTDLSGAGRLAWRLHEAVSASHLDNGTQLSMSLGVASLEPDDDEAGELLLARADGAMYRAKASNLGCVVAGSDRSI
jgi:diguanylate cyclase (GGDEF)-like protein/PAS domain S-box-containing protein